MTIKHGSETIDPVKGFFERIPQWPFAEVAAMLAERRNLDRSGLEEQIGNRVNVCGIGTTATADYPNAMRLLQGFVGASKTLGRFDVKLFEAIEFFHATCRGIAVEADNPPRDIGVQVECLL